MKLGFTTLVATVVVANAASATVIDQCTADMQASVNTLAAYKKCKTDSGFEFSKTAKADPAAFCASQKCLKLFKRLRKIDALSCTAYAGLSSLELWVKANSKECFKNTVDPEPDVDADTDSPETTAPTPTTPQVTAPAPVPTTTTPVTTAPVPTTTAPASTTAAPVTTTTAPEPTTTAPAPTTTAPEPTTTAPAPTPTTTAPAPTTTEPEPTAATPVTSTPAAASTTDVPAPSNDEPASSTTSPAPSTVVPAMTTPAPASTTTPAAPIATTAVPTTPEIDIELCTANIQAAVNTLPAYKKCKTDSGFEFSTTVKADTVAFCASQKCQKLFKQLRQLDALSCTAYAGLDSLELWVKGNPKACFKNSDDSDTDSDDDLGLTTAPGTTPAPSTMTSLVPTTTPPAQSSSPAPTSSGDVIEQCTTDLQAAVNTLTVYKKCKAESGFEFSQTAKTDLVAFCGSQKCLKLFKRLRKVDALSCTAYAGLDPLKLWEKGNPKECFKNGDDSESDDSDEDPDLTSAPGTTIPLPTKTSTAPTTTAPTPTSSENVIGQCTADMQTAVKALPAYKKCKTDSGFEFSTTAQADPVAFCASQKCHKLFKKLRSLDALSCTAYAGLESLELWVKGNSKECFKNTDNSDSDSDDDTDTTSAPAPTTTTPRSPTVTPQRTPAPPLTGASPGAEVGQDADTELSPPPTKTKKPHPTCS